MAGVSLDGLSFILDNTADTFGLRPGFLASFSGGFQALDGDDTVTGSTDSELIYGNRGDDNVAGGNGADILRGGQGNDTLFGDDGNDQLFGGKGDDLLNGGAGNDSLFGRAGDDILIGAAGTDTLTGGVGEDVFILQAESAVTDAAAADRIADFGNGFDQIGLSGGLTEASLRLEAAGSDTLIRVASSGNILGRVVGVSAAQLSGRFVSQSAAVAGELGAARNLGTLTGNVTVSDFVGADEPDDIYRFVLNTARNFNLTLGGLAADADVFLIQDLNSNNVIDFEEVVNASENGGSSNEGINISSLAAGTYFVQVFQSEGDSNYSLSLS